MLKKIVYLLVFATSVFAKDIHLCMEGYLGAERIDAAIKTLEEEKQSKTIIIQINSSSGEMQGVLSLAHKIHDLKLQEGKHVTVYIQGKAIGAAAIFPFIADKIITTPLVAWGNIPYGGENEMAPNQISAALKPLILQDRATTSTLEILVDAMVDPYYQLVYEGDVGTIEKDYVPHFDPLILNLKGMRSLGLVNQVLTDDAFATMYPFEKEQETYSIANSSSVELADHFHKYIRYSETEKNYVGYIFVGNARSIDQSTYIQIKFALKDFIKKKVRFVILDLNTPGGEVLSALKIVDLLQKLDIQHKIPVVAFVNNWAISAGAMLAYSCRFIAASSNSIMGAAEPVVLGQKQEMVSASEKINSALRAQFSTLASFYGRDPLVAEAMVDKDIILVVRDHKIVRLTEVDEIRRLGSHPDSVLSEKGKLLTLSGQQMMDLNVADFMAPITFDETVYDKKGEEETQTADENPIFHIPLFKQIPHVVLVKSQDWRVSFFTILTHPAIASLLLIGLVIGLYIEINTPGFGVFGSVALGCLALILLGSFASHTINWIEIIILTVGLILLCLELFVIPGFGITGIAGIILTIIGLFALMLPEIDRINLLELETFRLVGASFVQRLAWLFGGLVFAIAAIVLMARFFSERYFRFSKLVLKKEQEGYVSGIPRDMMPEIGALGETVTPLRPSGKVHVGENLFDATSQGNFIEKNTPVEVLRVEGSRVIVKTIKKRDDFS